MLKIVTKRTPRCSLNPNGTLLTRSTSIFSLHFTFPFFRITTFPFLICCMSHFLSVFWEREKNEKREMNLSEVRRSYTIGRAPIEVEKALHKWIQRYPTVSNAITSLLGTHGNEIFARFSYGLRLRFSFLV